MAQPSSRLEKPTKRSPNCLRHFGLKSPEKLVSFCSMNSVCSMVASLCTRINISVRNDNFYSENAFGQRFQCLQLFIGFSQLFIDFPDIGPLLKIEKVKQGICSLLAPWDITLPLILMHVYFLYNFCEFFQFFPELCDTQGPLEGPQGPRGGPPRGRTPHRYPPAII